MLILNNFPNVNFFMYIILLFRAILVPLRSLLNQILSFLTKLNQVALKKFISLFAILQIFTLCAQAQDIDLDLLHVQDSSMLNVNSPVREGCDVSIVGRNNPLFVHRTGTAYYTTSFLPAIHGKVDPSLSGRNVGVYGEACHDDINTNSNNIGVMGCATGNDLGSCFGVMGYLDYNNGAAVYGSTGTKYGTTLHGRYAGFFRGPVRIIGSLEASSILGNSASGNSVSTYQTFDATEQNINQSVGQSLSNKPLTHTLSRLQHRQHPSKA